MEDRSSAGRLGSFGRFHLIDFGFSWEVVGLTSPRLSLLHSCDF